MTSRPPGRRFLKISGYVLGFLVVASVAFHFWFKAHARQLIEDLVESRSNGKIRLKVDKFSFNWFSKKMEFEDAVFISTDTLGASTSYRFSVEKIKLKVDAILPIVFDKRIIIDTLTLLQPEIRVTRLKRSEKRENSTEADVSLPEEMGNIYNSIQDALQVLRVSRFLIDQGSFVLVNKIRPDQRPIVIDNLFFRIDNLSVDTTIEGARDKILFSDNVILRTHDQDIIFPDERHRLSFSKFNIDLQQKLVEFDSCTIAALKTDSSSAAFTMYMDALKLIDIDFDTLYKAEVIKADSVYCVNPKFNLAVELGKKKGENATPRLEDIIKQLTGDLQLDNVVVSNADFNIKTIKDGVPTSYSFTRNSFDMQGLEIDQDARSPIRVRSFAMAIRNYENFIRDSSYSVQFDSVLFRDDRIFLSNFVFHKLNKGRIVNSFNIPQFYLGGLSWDDLVFGRKLKADQATLFYPRIDYTVSEKMRRPGGSNVFQSLASINEVMDLTYLDIIDGSIDLKVNDRIRIQLEQATLSIESYNLLQSTRLAGIKNSVTSLDFRDGVIRAGEITMKLKDIRYLGESGHLTAGFLDVNDANGKLDMELEQVVIDKMVVDEKRGDIFTSDISWEKGKVNIQSGGGARELASVLNIQNVRGKNTALSLQMNGTDLKTQVNEVSFNRLDKRPGIPIKLDGLAINGSALRFRNKNAAAEASQYELRDGLRASLQNIRYSRSSPGGEMTISMPRLLFTPYVQTYLDDEARFDDVVVSEPRLLARLHKQNDVPKPMPQFRINSLLIEKPRIDYLKKNGSDSITFTWDASREEDAIVITDLQNQKGEGWDLLIKKASFDIFNLRYRNALGRKFETGSGSMEAELSDVSLKETTGKTDWQAHLERIRAKGIVFDNLGKNKSRLDISSLLLRDLGLSTASITNLQDLTRANARFQVSDFNGSLTNLNSALIWQGLSISRPDKRLSLDSLSLTPSLPADSLFAISRVQKDHVQLRANGLSLVNADIESFIRDRTLAGSELDIGGLHLTVTKDTRLPRDSGVVKSLPVNLIRDLGIPIQVERLRTRNGSVLYTEISKNGNRTTIPISRIALDMRKIKNQDFEPGDSLYANISGMLLDSIGIELTLRQSYEDDLSGMRIKARFSPARMQVLNAATVPMGQLYIKNGQLDSAVLVVVANEYLAFGEMRMNYQDLKVQLLKDGEGLDGKNTKGLLSFLANAFVIKNKGEGRPAVIFVTRDRGRSIFNYLVKIATRGFQTSIGVGKNKKLKRAYEAELKARGLAPLSQ